jgi:hypothetical protein
MLLPLINVCFPANAQLIFEILNVLFSFSFVDTSVLENKMFKYKEYTAYNPQFELYDIF